MRLSNLKKATVLLAGMALGLAICALAPAAAPSGPPVKVPTVDPAALERSLAMLQQEMKLNVLQTFYARGGLYFPPQWPQRINDEYRALAIELDKAASLANADIDKWLTESCKSRENEALAMYKMVEENIPKLFSLAKSNLDEREFEQKLGQWQRDHNKNLVPVARYVEDLVRPIYLANKGKPTNIAEKIWSANARALYCGRLKDTDDLVTAITAYDKERADIESHLVLLKEFESGVEIAQAVQEPVQKLIDTASEKALEKVQDYLKENYTDIDPKKVEELWGNRKKELEQLWSLNDKLTKLDEDPVLKGNDNARAIAKRFAIMGALYKHTLGRVKNTAVIKAMGPLADFLAFYGEAIDLIPEIATKMQSTVNQVDQDLRNVRALDQWNVTGLPPGELRQLTTFDSFGLHIGTDAAIDSITAPGTKFLMLVDKEIVPRGFATLNAEQFNRMIECLAYERFINAPAEASRGIGDWLTENMFEWKSTSVLSAVASDAYLTELKKKTRVSGLKPKDLLDLSHNLPITVDDKQWTADQLRSEAERKLDARAEEMIVRTALSGYRDEYLTEWRTFKEMLRKHGVAFTPPQIIKLFAFYHNSGANAAHLEKYLQAQVKEQMARARGRVEAGVPLVGSNQGATPLSPGTQVTFNAQVIASNLLPGREVPATATWVLPAGIPAPPPVQITLKNEVKQLTLPVEVPKSIKEKEVEAVLTVEVQPEPGEDAMADALASDSLSTEGPPEGQTKASAEKRTAAKTRQFTGLGLFGIQQAGPLEIITRKSGSVANGLAQMEIVITSQTLAELDPQARYYGVSFSVQRAASPSGPWHDISDTGSRIAVFPYKAESYVDPKVRPDPSTYIVAWSEQASYQKGQFPYQPLFYRVSQMYVTRDPGKRPNEVDTTSGEEQFSNIAAPAAPAIEVFARRPGPATRPADAECQFTHDPACTEMFVRSGELGVDNMVRVYATLCQPGQGYRYYDTHYTVKFGGGTWHFYDSPSPFPRDPKQPQKWENFDHLRVPLNTAGGQVSVRAESSGATATRDITLVIDPAIVVSRKSSLESAQKQQTTPADQREATTKPKEAAIKQMELEVGDPAQIKDSWPAFQWGPTARNLESARLDLSSSTEYGWPMEDLRKDLLIAELSCDWPKALQLRRKRVELIQKWHARYAKYLDANDTVLQQWAALVQRFKDDEGRKQLEQIQTSQADIRKSKPMDNFRELTQAYAELARAAVAAGDAAAHAEATNGLLTAMRQCKPFPNGFTPLERTYASDIVTMSGDRQAAAKALEEATQWQLGCVEGVARQQREQSENSRPKPAWWPQQ